MNRKNTILIAVMINAGLLTVLLVAALTTEERVVQSHSSLANKELTLPKFDDPPLYEEFAPIAVVEPKKKEEDSPSLQIVHKLPALEEVTVPEAPSIPAVKPPPIAKAPSPSQIRPTNEVIVQKGDNLEKIARKYHTSVDEIIKLNHLPSSFLKIGQVLKIPAGHSLVQNKEKVKDAGPEYYTIKVGENPWAIALRHHMKLDELLRLNGLNEAKARKLRPGDRLRIR